MCIEKAPMVLKKFKVEAPTLELAFIKARKEASDSYDFDPDVVELEASSGYLFLDNVSQYVCLWDPSEERDEGLVWVFNWCVYE